MIDLGNYKDYFSEKVGQILTAAIDESKKRQHSHLAVEHLFIAFSRIEKEFFRDVLFDLGLDPQAVLQQVDRYLTSSVEYLGVGMHVTAATKNILRLAWKEAQHGGRKLIESSDLFIAFFQDEATVPSKIFNDLGVNSSRVLQTVSWRSGLLEREKGKTKSFAEVKHYKRRKRWLT